MTRKVRIMATFTELTVSQDLAVRQHLATLAKSLRKNFAASYQGDYIDTVTGVTVGDRVQSGIIATVAGVKYLLVLNVLVSRKTGGAVSVRVSSWTLNAKGRVEGTWVIARTEIKSNGKSVRITPNGIVGVTDLVPVVRAYFNGAKAKLRAKEYGRPVVQIHTDKTGSSPYDTTDEHLLPFGGSEKVRALLMQ